MRLFTAIDMPENVKESLRTLLELLRPTAKLSWARPENLHITTKFIGEWPEARLDEMKRALGAVKAPSFDLAIGGIGWFPDARRPRVLFLGVNGGDELKKLAQATESVAATLGVAKEDREYSPHLTLARVRERVPTQTLRVALATTPHNDLASFRATAFYLYLSAAGKYTKLAEFPLTEHA
jgi:2'-5' RNA ligase